MQRKPFLLHDGFCGGNRCFFCMFCLGFPGVDKVQHTLTSILLFFGHRLTGFNGMELAAKHLRRFLIVRDA